METRMKRKETKHHFLWVLLVLGCLATLYFSQSAYAADDSFLRKSSESFRAVAKKVGPSVVTIRAKHQSHPSSQSRLAPRPGGPSFNHRFNPFEEFMSPFQVPPGANPREEQGDSSGSGFVIDPRGYILTNYHVVKGAQEFEVTLPDDQEKLSAKLIGKDARTDLAVIKVESRTSLSAIVWENTDNVEVGDWAIAIGSPFMLSHSVTAGIVSAKGRNASNVMGAEFGYDLIQTDAAINPGNSGGPLCTLDAKVMGVNTAIYSKSGGYMGIGFAIPSSTARETAEKLIQKGKVERGWMGIRIAQTDKELLKDLGIKSGVLVHEVDENSPAEKAGIHPGDVIVQIGATAMTEPNEVQKFVGSKAPLEKIKVSLIDYQNKKKKEVEVKLAEIPEQNPN